MMQLSEDAFETLIRPSGHRESIAVGRYTAELDLSHACTEYSHTVIRPSNIGFKSIHHIELDSSTAILPTSSMRPRIIKTEEQYWHSPT